MEVTDQTWAWAPKTDPRIRSQGSRSQVRLDHISNLQSLSIDPMGSYIDPHSQEGDIHLDPRFRTTYSYCVGIHGDPSFDSINLYLNILCSFIKS